MIREFPLTAAGVAEADAIPEPKHVWRDGAVVRVYTEDDMPTKSPIGTISRRQFRMALTAIGLRDIVETVVASADRDTRDWYDTDQFDRNHPVLLRMAFELGKTEADIDQLFTVGAAL